MDNLSFFSSIPRGKKCWYRAQILATLTWLTSILFMSHPPPRGLPVRTRKPHPGQGLHLREAALHPHIIVLEAPIRSQKLRLRSKYPVAVPDPSCLWVRERTSPLNG